VTAQQTVTARLKGVIMNAVGGCGNSWGVVGNSWGHLNNSWGYVGNSWGYVGNSWGKADKVFPPPQELIVRQSTPETFEKLIRAESGRSDRHIDLQA
jgi:hypothetical protein